MPDSPYRALAHKLKKVARDEAVKAHAPPLRMQVTGTSPIVAEEIHGDLIVEEGDDDVDVAQAVYDYDQRVGIAVGDMVIVDRHDDDYLIRDVVSDTDIPIP